MRHKTTLASILLFMISFVSVAQGLGDNPPPPMPPPPPGLPVDGVFFYNCFNCNRINLRLKNDF